MALDKPIASPSSSSSSSSASAAAAEPSSSPSSTADVDAEAGAAAGGEKRAPSRGKLTKKSTKKKKKSWRHGVMTNDEAESLFRAAGMEDGQFFVRSIEGKKAQFILSVVHHGKPSHHKLFKSKDKKVFCVGGKTFGDDITKMTQLIAHLEKPKVEGWPVQLSTPIKSAEEGVGGPTAEASVAATGGTIAEEATTATAAPSAGGGQGAAPDNELEADTMLAKAAHDAKQAREDSITDSDAPGSTNAVESNDNNGSKSNLDNLESQPPPQDADDGAKQPNVDASGEIKQHEGQDGEDPAPDGGAQEQQQHGSPLRPDPPSSSSSSSSAKPQKEKTQKSATAQAQRPLNSHSNSNSPSASPPPPPPPRSPPRSPRTAELAPLKPIDWMVTTSAADHDESFSDAAAPEPKPKLKTNPVRPPTVEVTASLQKVPGKEGHSAGFGFKFETFYDTGTYIVSVKSGLPADLSPVLSPKLRVVSINGKDIAQGYYKADIRSMILKAGDGLNLGLMNDSASYAQRKWPKMNFDASGQPHQASITFAVSSREKMVGRQASGIVVVGVAGAGLFIHAVEAGSAAADSGMIAPNGMQLLMVNGRSLGAATARQVMAWMAEANVCTLIVRKNVRAFQHFLAGYTGAAAAAAAAAAGSNQVYARSAQQQQQHQQHGHASASSAAYSQYVPASIVWTHSRVVDSEA